VGSTDVATTAAAVTTDSDFDSDFDSESELSVISTMVPLAKSFTFNSLIVALAVIVGAT
jgi:hypothetical protein